MPRVEITGGFYEDSALQFDAQECINMNPVLSKSEGGKGRNKLKGAGGHASFASIGMAFSDKQIEIVGSHVTSSGRFFVVWGSKNSVPDQWDIVLGEVLEGGTINIVTASGISGQPVFTTIADNGSVLCVVTGQQEAFFYNLSTGSWDRITDPDFPASVFDVYYKDTYFVWLDADTDRFYISSNNATDPTDCVNALDFGTVESNPDSLKGIMGIGNEIAIFGTKTIEFFYNSGNVDFPFDRNSGSTQEIGAVSSQSIQKIDDKILFIGRNEKGSGIVYVMNGYIPTIVSTIPIENKINLISDIDNAVAFVYRHDGNSFYNILTSESEYLQYNIDIGVWNIININSDGFPYSGSTLEYGKPKRAEYAFNKNFLILKTDTSSIIYLDVVEIDSDTYHYVRRLDSTGALVVAPEDAIARTRTMQHLSIENRDVIYKSFELDIQKGVANADDADPTISISKSKDGGMIYGTPKVVRIGGTNTQQRVRIKRLGRGRDVVFKIESDSPVQQEWFTAYLEYEVLDD